MRRGAGARISSSGQEDQRQSGVSALQGHCLVVLPNLLTYQNPTLTLSLSLREREFLYSSIKKDNIPSVAKRKALPRNSGTLKSLIFARPVSINTRPTPASRSFTASTKTAIGIAIKLPASAIPHGKNAAIPRTAKR